MIHFGARDRVPRQNRDTSTQHDAARPNTPVCPDLASTLATIHGARQRTQALLAVRSTPAHGVRRSLVLHT